LHRLTLTPAANIGLSRRNRSEKIVLLDPIQQHSYLRVVFENNLLVYRSIYDCFHELTSNRHNDYTVFLSRSTFEVHSLELSRLSNVSLGIFYEDSDQSHPQISKIKYNIRFLFPKGRLFEHLRHAVILNYAKQAHTYRLQGLDDEADQYFLAASQQCRMLADELERQSTIAPGIETDDSGLHNSENADDLVLRPSTFTLPD